MQQQGLNRVATTTTTTTNAKNSPLLLTIVVLLPVTGNLPLPRLGTLHERTLLLVELTQDTQHCTFVYDTATLTSPTSVTGPLSSSTNVGNGTNRGDGLDLNQVFLSRQGTLCSGTGGSDGDRSGTWHGRLYSHDGRHIDDPRWVWFVGDKSGGLGGLEL